MSLKPTYGHLKSDSDAAKIWREVMGADNDLMVPLRSPLPIKAPNPKNEIEEYYLVDLKQLKPEEVERLAQVMAKTFNVSISEVREGFSDPEHGMPMRTSNFSGVSFDARLVL